MIRSHEFPPVRRSAAYRCTVYGPFRPCGGGETVLPVKQLKEWRLSGLDETVCYDLEFRAHGAVPSAWSRHHPRAVLLVEAGRIAERVWPVKL